MAVLVPIIYVALSQADSYMAEQAKNLSDIGIGLAVQGLLAGAIDNAAEGLATCAIFFGITMPAIGKYYARKAQEEEAK